MAEEVNISPELRKKVEQKPTFNILYIGDGDSRLSLFRGEAMIRNFSTFYAKYANISYLTASPEMVTDKLLSELKDVNILWVDNVMDPHLVKVISNLQVKIMEEINPNWRQELTTLKEESDDKAVEFIQDLKSKRASKLRVIYSIDEFIWEAPAGRMISLQGAKIVESLFQVADTIVVPTADLKDAILHFGFCPPLTEFILIPTAVSHEFFPLYKNFERKVILNGVEAAKAKVLVKGLTLSKNVQEFIASSYKDYDITISSIGELSDPIMGLIGRKKIKHVYHWANPVVNKNNFTHGYAMERDTAYDFLIYSFSDDLSEQIYELTMGDEDILFAVASGTLPICGCDHVGFEGTSLFNASGVTFGKDTAAKEISEKIRILRYNHLKFNEAYNRCRSVVENRLAAHPGIVSGYYAAMVGRDVFDAKTKIARAEMAKQQEAEGQVAPDNKTEDAGSSQGSSETQVEA